MKKKHEKKQQGYKQHKESNKVITNTYKNNRTMKKRHKKAIGLLKNHKESNRTIEKA